MSKGFKSSEFTVSILGIAAIVLPELLKIVPEESSLARIIGVAILAVGYVGSRTYAKSKCNENKV